jgi:hypothetical protein
MQGKKLQILDEMHRLFVALSLSLQLISAPASLRNEYEQDKASEKLPQCHGGISHVVVMSCNLHATGCLFCKKCKGSSIMNCLSIHPAARELNVSTTHLLLLLPSFIPFLLLHHHHHRHFFFFIFMIVIFFVFLFFCFVFYLEILSSKIHVEPKSRTVELELYFNSPIFVRGIKKLRGFSPQANYTDRVIAAGQRS